MKNLKKFENFKNEFNIGDKVKLKESSHSLDSNDKNSFWYNQYGTILDYENVDIENYGKIPMYLIHLESELNAEMIEFIKNSITINKNGIITPDHNKEEEKYNFWVSPNYLVKI